MTKPHQYNKSDKIVRNIFCSVVLVLALIASYFVLSTIPKYKVGSCFKTPYEDGEIVKISLIEYSDITTLDYYWTNDTGNGRGWNTTDLFELKYPKSVSCDEFNASKLKSDIYMLKASIGGLEERVKDLESKKGKDK